MSVIYNKEVLGKGFKIYGTEENPLFLARDVAEWIDYSKTSQGYYNVSKMLMTIDEDEKVTITNSNSGGKKVYLTEYGLYEVLMQSRKPIAKLFKKEVKVILKQIRQTGGYIPVTEQDDDLTIMSKALMIMQNTLSKKDELIEQKDKEIISLSCELEETTTENEALRGEFFNKDDITKIFMLIRRYGSVVGFGKAWNEFYREMNYNFGIRLKLRKGTFDEKFKTDDEVAKGIQCAVALCGNKGIRTADIFQ